MIKYLEYLMENINMPLAVAVAIIVAFVVMQLVGELLEFKGKAVPEFVKIRKFFARKKVEKQKIQNEREETAKTLKEVKQLLNDVNQHYSADNIAKRDEWMQWVNDRVKVYDASIVELIELKEHFKENNAITLDMYININRNRILDFASKVVDGKCLVSREEYNRIFKIYEEYEETLEKYGKTNGEVDIAYRIINESYEEHMKKHSFIEDNRGWH
jgi:hypothetical protein